MQAYCVFIIICILCTIVCYTYKYTHIKININTCTIYYIQYNYTVYTLGYVVVTETFQTETIINYYTKHVHRLHVGDQGLPKEVLAYYINPGGAY